jgi:hypothetical protein
VKRAWAAGTAFALTLLVPAGLYLAAAGLLSQLAVNANWREPPQGITIFIQTNGVHTGIVLPDGPGHWRAFGWGDRDFYLNTPTWRAMRPGTIISALIGSGHSVLHVDRLRDFAADENWRPLRVRPAEYARIRAFIAATRAPGPVIPGYGRDDDFHPARGRYNAFHTCNSWVGAALTAGGVRTARWTPFSDGIMRWVPVVSPRPSPDPHAAFGRQI